MIPDIPFFAPGTVVELSTPSMSTHSMIVTCSHHRVSENIAFLLITLGSGVLFEDRFVKGTTDGEWKLYNLPTLISFMDSDWLPVE